MLTRRRGSEINDTWWMYTPETGYPVRAAARPEKIAAPAEVAARVEPRRDVVTRRALYAGAALCYIGAVGWVISFFV